MTIHRLNSIAVPLLSVHALAGAVIGLWLKHYDKNAFKIAGVIWMAVLLVVSGALLILKLRATKNQQS